VVAEDLHPQEPDEQHQQPSTHDTRHPSQWPLSFVELVEDQHGSTEAKLAASDGFPIGPEAGGGQWAVVEDPVEPIEHPEEDGASDAIEQAQQQELDEREPTGHGLGIGEGKHPQGQERHAGPGSKPDPELGKPLVAQN
jgi:hypothetical protein